MKQITNKTILKQGDKVYYPVKVDGVIYWGKKSNEDWFNFYREDEYWFFVAQSQLKIEGFPVIGLDSYIEKLKKGISEFSKLANDKKDPFWTGKAAGFGEALQIYKSNPNQYTLSDIEKAIDYAANPQKILINTKEEILEQINSISTINVDDNFNIINYE